MNDTYSYKESVSVEEAKLILAEYKKTLPEDHNEFVRKQLEYEYISVTRTITIGEQTFTGTFREAKDRKKKKNAYRKESKIAAVLASKGFDIVLLKEEDKPAHLNSRNNSQRNTKPDALVNCVVMDFKEIIGNSKNTLGNNYQDAMKKNNTYGAVMFVVKDISEKDVFNQLAGKTRSQGNGIVLVYHENKDALQIINMKNLRAAHERTARIGMASANNANPHNELGAKSQSNLNINLSENSVNKKQ